MVITVKLQEAKRAIGIVDFKSDDLLKTVLTDLSDLNHPAIAHRRECSERDYRRLAFLGDALFDAVLADYLFRTNQNLTHKDLDDWRQKIASKESFTEFAIQLGLPRFSSSWDKPRRKPPEEEPRLWAEMFEALIAVIFINYDRDFLKLSEWLCNCFIREATDYQDF